MRRTDFIENPSSAYLVVEIIRKILVPELTIDGQNHNLGV